MIIASLLLFAAIWPFGHFKPAASTVENMLGSTNWVSATAGWGTIHKNQTIVGNRITLNGHVYQTGIGTHANSDITYNVQKSCSAFQSDIGVDDEEGTNGTVVFQVFGDGKRIYSSPVMRGKAAHKKISVSIAGVSTVLLRVTDAGDNINFDHADWAGGKFLCSKILTTDTTGTTGGSGKSMAWKTGFYEVNWDGYTPSNVPWSKYTHIIHFATTPGPNGTIDPGNVSDSEAYDLVSQGHANGVKVLYSITSNTPYFDSNSTTYLSTFVNNLIARMNQFGYDGIDLDWESNIDEAHYGTLISTLRSNIGAGKLITVSAYGGGGVTPLGGVLAAGPDKIDQVNMMTYDMDMYEALTGWVTGIFQGSPPSGDNFTSIEDAINNFTSRGVPANKLGIGIPFYGRKYNGASGPFQTRNYGGSLNFNQVDTSGNVYNSTYGGQSATHNGNWYPYTGPEQINAIVSYGNTRGVGGYFTFSLFREWISSASGDARSPLSTALAAAVGGGATPAPDPGSPTINSFTVTPTAVTSGGTVTVIWDVIGADSLSLSVNGGTPSTVTGTSTTVSVTGPSDFELIATNTSGSTTSTTQHVSLFSFAPSSNPSYAGVLSRSMIRIDWEVSSAQAVTVWKNRGTGTQIQVGGSSATGAQNVWVRDVMNGDVFSLVDHDTGTVLASFTETVVQVSASFTGGFNAFSFPGWTAGMSAPQGLVILDSNGNMEIALQAGTGVAGSSEPIWSTTTQNADTDPPTVDGTIHWFNNGPPSAERLRKQTGNVTWTVTNYPTDLTTAAGLGNAIGLWTTSTYGSNSLTAPGVYTDPPTPPLHGDNAGGSYPFQKPTLSTANYMGPFDDAVLAFDLGILNRYGPDVTAGWIDPGSRFYITWASNDAIQASLLFADAGQYFVAATLDVPNPYVDYFLADPAIVYTYGTPTGTTTLKWKTGFDKVAILYGRPQQSYVQLIPSNTSGQGNLVAAIDHIDPPPEGVGQDYWEITLNGWVPDGALFILYDASTWNTQNFASEDNSTLFVEDFQAATLTVTVRNNATVLNLSPNPVNAVSGSGTSTLSWNAPDSTSVIVRKDNPTTGAIVASGGSTGSASLTGLINGTIFYLVDGTSGAVLRSVSVTVQPGTAIITATPNPIPTTRSGSTTLTWSGGTSSTSIRVDDPLSGTLVTTGGASGSFAVGPDLVGSGRAFFLTDADGNVLSQVVVTLLYTGSGASLFGLPIPDPVAQLVALGAAAPVFPVDPDYAFTAGRAWKTNTVQMAPNLVKQMYILDEVPEISFEIGLAVQQGSLQPAASTATKFRLIYAFYRQMMGSGKIFYFYDPRKWGTADYTPVNYREDPRTRLTSTGTGNNPSPVTGRYVMRFAEDQMNFERFALLLVRSQLKLTGFAG